MRSAFPGVCLLGFVLAGCGASRVPPGAKLPPAPARPPAAPAKTIAVARPLSPAARALGLPPVAPGPLPGYLLIADRNNGRLLIVSPDKRIVWRFPRPGDVRPGQTFSDPDDAFFAPGFRRIVTNEEFNDTAAQIEIRSRRIVWSYGLAQRPGSASGELSHPDDAYVLPNHEVQIADIQNCRVIRLTTGGRIAGSIGSAGRCVHDPPRSLQAPNGATPLPGGGVLVTEIGGWIDRIDAHGKLVYSLRTPTTYPSDAQLLPNGDLLVAGFNTPGRVDELTPTGRVVWTYGPTAGPGSLDRPSLAVRWPNGMIAVTDDWHHRVIVIDPRTKRIVWQYGHFGIASSADGYLSKPDGLDLLPAATGRAAGAPTVVRHAHAITVTRVGTLPVAASRIAAVADGSRLLVLGGLTAAGSSDQILLGPPSRLRLAGRLPAPTHDAAAAHLGPNVYLFGGGEAVSRPDVVRIDPATGAARRLRPLDEPLSDLGAAVSGGRVYLIGGYTGSRWATAVLRYRPGAPQSLVTRLPAGLRYAGTAAAKGRLYVAGGATTAGETSAVLEVDPATRTVRRIATLPEPLAHAPLVALGRSLYLIGGLDSAGTPLAQILRIDSRTGRVTSAGDLPRPLADAGAVTLAGRVIVLGGFDGTAASNAVLAFRPR